MTVLVRRLGLESLRRIEKIRMSAPFRLLESRKNSENASTRTSACGEAAAIHRG
jgi:hypothetical protein